MYRVNKRILLIVVVQSFIVTFGSLIFYSAQNSEKFPQNFWIGEVQIGGLTPENAKGEIKKYYDTVKNEGYCIIETDLNQQFKIKFTDIELNVDYDATIKQAYDNSFKIRIPVFFPKGKRTVYSPVIYLNKEKLKGKLLEISSMIDKNPENADIFLENVSVIKTAGNVGRKLNIDNSIMKIENSLYENLQEKIDFNIQNDFEIQKVLPKMQLINFNELTYVIATYKIKLNSSNDIEEIRNIVKAMNKTLLLPAGSNNGNENAEFSYKKIMDKNNLLISEKNEAMNLVASAIFGAVLKAGIDKGISRKVNVTRPEFILPGLDVLINDKYDFKFVNTKDTEIMIFASLIDGYIKVDIVGNQIDNKMDREIETEISQIIEPTSIFVENPNLQDGEKRVLTQGVNGLIVNVYRVDSSNGYKTKTFLFKEEYQPISSMMEIGKNTEMKRRGIK